LILHGCLHLLGYDHERDGDAALMEKLESDALASIGIGDPYSRPDHVGMEK
jgi:probable rRNA maturation factor